MCNDKLNDYFNSIDEYVEKAYDVASLVRETGYDPELFVEMPLAKEISQRVEGLVSVLCPQILGSGVSGRLLEFEDEFGKLDWRVGLEIAYEVARGDFCEFEDRKEAMEIGIRVGFSYLTLGVISAPLEGFIDLDVKLRCDGKKYLAMNFAGPIRAAGGTAGAVCVLIGDYVRKKFGYASYDACDAEVLRVFTEICDYDDKCARLQYFPSVEEVRCLIESIGVEISGSPTDEIEVSGYKDLDRIETNLIRGGMCLVVAECVAQKASKIFKRVSDWGSDFGLSDWLFLEDFLGLQKSVKAKSSDSGDDSDETILPNYKFIDDVVGGRPVLGFPMARGGFRLRYGRSRTSGFASTCVSSQTMDILDEFVAVGTQLRLERPGKATVVTACDSLEPPIVKLKDGSVVKLRTREEVEGYLDEIDEIIHLGDLLVSYGEFFENNHVLVPNGYCEEEWICELVDKISDSENR